MSWHEREKATVIVGLIIGVFCLLLYYCIISSKWDCATLREPDGLPLAHDFANVWAASKLALAGKPALAYDMNQVFEVELQNIGSCCHYGSAWYYPPTFLLLVLPLASMPYLLSLFVWLSITFILYIIVLSRIGKHPIILPLCVLFPGIFENFAYGQNTYLSGALMGGGLLLLDRMPFIAGCLFGLLSFKPPLIIISLIALGFGRHWKALIGVLTSSIILIIISLAVFGMQVWVEYFKVMSLPMKFLEAGQADWSLTMTFFAAALAAGLSVKSAYLIQGVVMLFILLGVRWTWQKKISLPLRGSVLVLGTILFTPYSFIYELALLALPLVWLWEEGRTHGRFPGELFLLFCGWISPLAIPIFWNRIDILDGKLQAGPLFILMLFILALFKALRTNSQGETRCTGGTLSRSLRPN